MNGGCPEFCEKPSLLLFVQIDCYGRTSANYLSVSSIVNWLSSYPNIFTDRIQEISRQIPEIRPSYSFPIKYNRQQYIKHSIMSIHY